MRKLIIKISGFTLNKTIKIYDDANMVAEYSTSMNKLVDDVMEYSEKYSIEEIVLAGGNATMLGKYKQQLQEKNKIRYNKEINIIII